MRALLAELDKEASSLRREGARYADFGYKKRTRFERLLFLILEEYCAKKLNYEDLGGLTHVHRSRFRKLVAEDKRSTEEGRIAEEGFQVYAELHELCTAHIYSPGQTVTRLGGDATRVLVQIAEKVEEFIREVRNSYY